MGRGGALGGLAGVLAAAGVFMARILEEELAGRRAARWSELHSGHGKLITRARSVLCST